jgi:hypothetical protein
MPERRNPDGTYTTVNPDGTYGRTRGTPKAYFRQDPDGTWIRHDPDGTTHVTTAWDPARLRGIGCLIVGLIVFVIGMVIIVVVASHVGHSGG